MIIERFEKFSLAIAEITHYLHKIAADEMSKYELKWSHALCLMVLSRFRQGITATKLCELCGRDKADVSRAIALLREKGLVEKNDVVPKYRATIMLTEAGFLAADHIRERAKVAVETASRGVSDDQRAVFYEVLDVIVNNMQTMSEQGVPE